MCVCVCVLLPHRLIITFACLIQVQTKYLQGRSFVQLLCNMAAQAAATCVDAHVWLGNYNMLEVIAAERQKACYFEAMALIHKPRWEPPVHLKD